MEIKEVYYYLEAVEKIDAMIGNKIEEQRQILERATSGSQNMDGMPHGSGTSDKVGNAATNRAMIEAEIDRDIDFLYDYKQEVISYIQRLNAKEYDVLHKYYIQGWTLGQIAEFYAMKKSISYFSSQAVSKIKKKAVISLSKVLEESVLYETYKKRFES